MARFNRGKARFWGIVGGILVTITMLTMMVTNGFKDWNPYGWFDKNETTQTEVETEQNLDVGFINYANF